MSSGSRLLAALALCTGMASAQQTAGLPSPSSAAQQQAPPLLPTIHTGTQLVIVDVVVQDRNGHPVHGLTRENFVLSESKKPQTIRNFDEHTAASADEPAPALPPMPPGTFTNYTPVAPESTVNVLLIDRLNTPVRDQAFVLQQLRDFVKHERPGTQIAVFGLTSRLFMLQGFTSDQQVLREAVERHLLPGASSLLDDPTGSNVDAANPSDMMREMASGSAAIAPVIANLQQFEAETQSYQAQLRTQYTLDGFNALAHYLSNFPGRKNVIWFSGSFPINIEPDPTLKDPFAVMAETNGEFRETTNLLTHSQIAVYPVDARGLMTEPMFDASRSGSSYVRNETAFSTDLAKFYQSQAAEHATMDQMASDTGGHAFYNTNGLADAVGKAIDAGTNYYTLTYSPEDHNWNGSYRNIRVGMAGQYAGLGLKLSYRHGYYADDPESPRGNRLTRRGAASSATDADRAAAAYSRAAVTRGAPTPTDILFTARVLPTSGSVEDKLPPENRPQAHLQAPYRNFQVHFAALTKSLSLSAEPNGNHRGEVEFDALVYDADGNLLNSVGKRVVMNMNPDTYKRFLTSAIAFNMQVGTPAHQATFLRLLVRDVPSNRYGGVEIPTAQVARLSTAGTGPDSGSPAPAGGAPVAPKQ